MIRLVNQLFRTPCLLILIAFAWSWTQPAVAFADDELRTISRGEAVPEFILRGLDGKEIKSTEYNKGKVVVLTYLSAEQHSSELAAKDVSDLATRLANDDLRVILVTADVVHQSYFENLLSEMKITAPFGFDVSRDLYAKLGLIVMPTTIIIDKQGKLAHVIAIHRSDYAYDLEAHTLHTLGILNDKQLADRLAVHTYERGTPKSRATRHRAAANLLRKKGLAESAEAELKKALALDPENNDILLDMAEIELERGQLDNAKEIIDKSLKQNADNRRAQLLHGMFLFQTDQLDEAKTVLEKVLILNPDPARTHFYLGLIAERQEDYKSAVMHYREALLRVLDEPLLREQMRRRNTEKQQDSP